jgi:hypothetical protein
MPADRESTVKANGLDRLSDVLVEDIATTAGDRLLAEAAQDYGDQGALAAAFDAALAGVPTMHEIVVSSHGADHLADALCNDVLQTSEEHLLREVVQDYGDRRALAAKFDAVVAKIPASAVAAQAPRPRRMLGLTGAGTTRSPAAWLHVFVQERSTVLGRWFSDLSIGRAGVAALATLVLLAVITPGLYRSLDEPASVEPQTGPQISPQSGQQNSPTVPVPQVGVPIIPTAVVEVLSVEKLLHKRFEGLPGADLRRSEPYSREISQFVAEVRIKEVVVAGPGLAPNEIIKIRYDIEVLDPPLIGAPRQRQLKSGETTTVRLRNERNVYWLLDSGGEHSKAYLEDLERRYRTVDLR